MMTRREVLATIPLSLFSTPLLARDDEVVEPLRFGVITDIHHDIMPDGIDRVSAFVTAMNEAKVDFVCQLGDFCWPKPENRPFLDAFEKFQGERYHVLGNHDMDGGFAREKTVEFLGMPHRHYGFQKKGVQFLILDGNDPGGMARGYKRYVAKDQLDWLTMELAAATLPVIVLIHQPIDNQLYGIENELEVRAALKSAGPKVIAVFSGHHHRNYVQTIDNIPHVQFNSAAYYWIGEKFTHTTSYTEDIHKRFPSIRNTCPYKDPLWAIVTIDQRQGTIAIEGRETAWVGGSPWDIGASQQSHDPQTIQPRISSRSLTFKPENPPAAST